uniref:Uncharacterized protein n=1 Tax=Ditylenchus dipsaci TaxID=166011 RepID=A0A915D017_9BILA
MYLSSILRIGLGAYHRPLVRPLKQLENTVAAVYWWTSGLGRGAAEWLHSQGARVVILDLPQSEGDSVASSLGENACSFQLM